MYCSKCGNAVEENDRFCSECGNKLKKTMNSVVGTDQNVKQDNLDEEVIFNSAAAKIRMTESETERKHAPMEYHLPRTQNEEKSNGLPLNHEAARKEEPHKIDTSEFVWNIHEFDKRENTPKEVIVDWKHGKVIDKTQGIVETIQTQEEKKPIKVSSAPANEIPVQDKKLELCKEEEEDITPVTIEDIQNDIDNTNKDRKRDTARIDKFYTFHAKNEEFQKLLDKEYERIKNGRKNDTAEIYLDFEKLIKNDEGEATENKKIVAAEIDKIEETQDVEHIDKPSGVEMTEPVTENEKFDPVEHIKKAEQERNTMLGIAGQPTSDLSIMDNASIIKKFDTMELEKDIVGMEALEAEENQSEIEESPQEAHKFEPVILDEIFGKIKIEKASNEFQFEEQKAEKVEGAEESNEPFAEEHIITVPTEEVNAAKSLDEIFEETYVPQTRKEEAYDQYEYDDEPRRFTPGKVVLVIIIILLAIELVILGIKYIAPDSTAAKFINENLSIVAGLFTGDDEADDNRDQGDTPTDEQNQMEEPQKPVIDTAPMSDKDALIKLQLGNNKNIVNILPDEKLKYNPATSYGSSLIKDSVPLENNLLYTKGDGTPVYVDQTVVGTLIAFDSQWIDYVNTKDRSVFELLKADSGAYKNCSAYKKAGKVTKTFNSLEIGEIRAASSGYYVWAHEEIKTVDNGKISNDEFNWVYYMETVDQQMKIVDYYKF